MNNPPLHQKDVAYLYYNNPKAFLPLQIFLMQNSNQSVSTLEGYAFFFLRKRKTVFDMIKMSLVNKIKIVKNITGAHQEFMSNQLYQTNNLVINDSTSSLYFYVKSPLYRVYRVGQLILIRPIPIEIFWYNDKKEYSLIK